MPDDVVKVVKSALAAGVKIDVVNEMTMDFGDYYAPSPKGKMGTYAIQSIESAAKQLKQIGFPLGANPYASLGVTPMIGVNDNRRRDLRALRRANALRLGAERPASAASRSGPPSATKNARAARNTFAVDICSSIIQTPGQFSKIFAVRISDGKAAFE